MFKPVITVLTLALLSTTAQAQTLEQWLQKYGNQLQDQKLPRGTMIPDALAEQFATRGTPANNLLNQRLSADLKGLKTLGVLRRKQLAGLQRAFRNAPIKTQAMVSEVRRFAQRIKQPGSLEQLKAQLGASWRARRAQRLWLEGARNVLGTIARNAGRMREIKVELPELVSSSRNSLAAFGNVADNGAVRIPLGSLVLEIHGGGTFNILSRSAEPLVMTSTDPIYLTPAHIKGNRSASSWTQPICVYHFPDHGWTFIGWARTATGVTNKLLATDGQRTLILSGMNRRKKFIHVSSRPFAIEAARILTRKSGVQKLVYRNGGLHSSKPKIELTEMRCGKAWEYKSQLYSIGLMLQRRRREALRRLAHVSLTAVAYSKAANQYANAFAERTAEALRRY